MNHSDIVLTFVDSCCYVEKGLKTRLTDMWEVFGEWSEGSGIRRLKRRELVRRLDENFSLRRDPWTVHGLLLKQEDQWEWFNPEELRKVYLISNTLHTKIGVSVDPLTRMEALQTGSSLELSLVYQVDGGFDLESHLHDKFKAKRVRGEWFDLSPQDLVEVRSCLRNAGSFGTPLTAWVRSWDTL